MSYCAHCAASLPGGAKFCPACGAPAAALATATPEPAPAASLVSPVQVEITPGLTVVAGRYRVQQLIGQGGMGAVYKCLDLALGETVALKFLLGPFASDPKMIERFLFEIKTVRRIQHRAVVASYDLGEWQGVRFIVMQFVEGRSLATLIEEKRRLPLDEVLPLISQVVSGLKAAHDQGIVHRDLKTDNVLIGADGHAYILDFGIARRLDSGRLTTTGEVLGSPLYIAPEQAQGQDVDRRADIYSLGVILFEILTGELPYSGDDALAIALKHVMAPIPSARERLPALPAHVDRAIHRCLQKKPADRYGEVTELLQDLLLADSGVAAAAPAPTPAPESRIPDPRLARETVRPQAAPTPSPAAPRAPDGERKLLVIDHDEGQILTLKRELSREKIAVLSTKSGQHGVELAFSERPDAIIVNAGAPVIDGITLTQILRGNPQFASVPIFILCDRPDPSIVALQKPLRISGFVVRPIGGGELLGRLNEAWTA